MTRADAVRKVAALFRLAERPGTPEEGAAAVAAATALMEKYEVEQAALALDGEAFEPDEDLMDFTDMGDGQLDIMGRRLSWWRSRLASALARANGAYTFTAHRRAGRSIEIVGKPSAVEVVRYMYAWLSRELQRLCAEQGKGMGQVWRREFMDGAVAELSTRLWMEHQRTVANLRASAANNPHALTVINRAVAKVAGQHDIVKSYATEKHKLKSFNRGRNSSDLSAREQGAAAAAGIDLGRKNGIGTGPRRMIGGGR